MAPSFRSGEPSETYNATPLDSVTEHRRSARVIPSRRSYGQEDGKSTSPAPSGSTVSTRSKAFARSESGNSPEEKDGTLPTFAADMAAADRRRSKQRSRQNTGSERSESEPPVVPAVVNRLNNTSESSALLKQFSRNSRHSPPLSPAPESPVSDQGVSLVLDDAAPRANKTQSLTPDPAEIHLSSLDAPPKTSIIIRKRKAPLEDEIDGTSIRNGESSYEATPRTSPVLGDDAQLPGGNTEGTAQAENGKNGGLKRAPRKKRKWLKKGEVDPDDPVAVAKQKERHILLDQAEDLLVGELTRIDADTSESLQFMLAELQRRRGCLLERAEARHQRVLQDLAKMRDHAVQQAHANFQEHDDQVLQTLRDELRHFKHRIRAQASLAKKPVHTNPLRREVHGTRSWNVYDTHLLSHDTEDTVPCELDGEIRERRDHRWVAMRLSTEEAAADLAGIREAIKVGSIRSSSPDKPAASDSASHSKTDKPPKKKVLQITRKAKEMPPSRFERWAGYPSASSTSPTKFSPSALPSPWAPMQPVQPVQTASNSFSSRPPQTTALTKAPEGMFRSSSSPKTPNLAGSPHMTGQRTGPTAFAPSPVASAPTLSTSRPASTFGQPSCIPQRPSPVALAVTNHSNTPPAASTSISAKSNGERFPVDLQRGYRIIQTGR